MSLSEINEAVADSTNDETSSTEILNKAIKEEQQKEQKIKIIDNIIIQLLE